METSKAYDFPVRIFHWIFAFLFVLSFSIAQLIDDDSTLYAYHMLSGMLMFSIVILRLAWGFVGSKTSKFNSFKLKPSDFIGYIYSIMSTKSKRYLGHNPASSYAAIFMMVFSIGMCLTGLLMATRINKSFFEEIHELIANGFLVVVLLHITGALLHQIRHNDGMILSMLNGKKAKIDGETEIKSNHPIVAFVFVIYIIGMGNYLITNFDNTNGKLNAFGTHLQLGEKEHSEYHNKQNKYLEDEEHKENEDDNDW